MIMTQLINTIITIIKKGNCIYKKKTQINNLLIIIIIIITIIIIINILNVINIFYNIINRILYIINYHLFVSINLLILFILNNSLY